jgi:hypothetical protein
MPLVVRCPQRLPVVRLAGGLQRAVRVLYKVRAEDRGQRAAHRRGGEQRAELRVLHEVRAELRLLGALEPVLSQLGREIRVPGGRQFVDRESHEAVLDVALQLGARQQPRRLGGPAWQRVWVAPAGRAAAYRGGNHTLQTPGGCAHLHFG